MAQIGCSQTRLRDSGCGVSSFLFYDKAWRFNLGASARKTPVPDIYQLVELFGAVEPRSPPPPRKRGPPNTKAATSQSSPPKTTLTNTPNPAESTSFWDPVMQAIGLRRFQSTHPAPKPNPFVHLKYGRKSVVVAAVDGTMISFVRFGEGDFASWPMV